MSMNMDTELGKNLVIVKSALDEAETYYHAIHVLNFDLETICPPKAMEEQGDVIAFLDQKAFTLLKADTFINAAEYLYAHKDQLGEYDRVLAESLHREYDKIRNITPEKRHEYAKIENKSFVKWLEAKEASDYSIFSPSLSKIRDISLEQIGLRGEKKASPYDSLLDDYERGITSEQLDELFGECKERLIPLLEKITSAKKTIRTDFMSAEVEDRAQEKMAQKLLDIIGFDKSRGTMALAEHPFTDSMNKDDARITTHYYPANFASSMYSVIHEGGHALFEQNQPAENWEYHIDDQKSMGQHESVSRFYENLIGRSEAFAHLIYEPCKEIFPEAMCGGKGLEPVSERQLYEALNVVNPSLIRTEADEFTYTFHIIIRYELEKAIVNHGAKIEDLPAMWNAKYEEYLGVTPDCDKHGILQDVHWSSGFGYFPSYAIGNFYNAMYYNRMKEELDVESLIRSGDLITIRDWMTSHVFSKADRLAPADWIKEITGRSLTAKDYLDYLEGKYKALYDL